MRDWGIAILLIVLAYGAEGVFILCILFAAYLVIQLSTD